MSSSNTRLGTVLLSLTLISWIAGAECFVIKKCNLQGQWKNELGSNMTLGAPDRNGFFTGTYLTAVTANKTLVIKQSPLTGNLNMFTANAQQRVFGFLVNWTFSDSVTSFVGQCFVQKDGTERLQTTWLLRGLAATEEDNWSQTRHRVGTNVFTRLCSKMTRRK
uniref:Avidin n=1 Tax=Lepisosteus oculatus TaxID=7918 RepID=W5M5U0_LEPOC